MQQCLWLEYLGCVEAVKPKSTGQSHVLMTCMHAHIPAWPTTDGNAHRWAIDAGLGAAQHAHATQAHRIEAFTTLAKTTRLLTTLNIAVSTTSSKSNKQIQQGCRTTHATLSCSGIDVATDIGSDANNININMNTNTNNTHSTQSRHFHRIKKSCFLLRISILNL